jgi:hypothetical protein
MYCPKCGKQNADDSRYCNGCGSALLPGMKDVEKDWDDKCQEGCSGSGRTGLWFWGVIVVLIGLWFIFELGIKNIKGLPDWLTSLEWGWIFGIVIGAVILGFGVSMIVKAARRQ